LAELFRRGAKLSFPQKDSDGDALRFRRQADKFDMIVGWVTECVRGDGHSGARTDRGKNTGPTVMLLHDARFITRARENRREVFLVTRILLRHEANEGFARGFGQGDGSFFREEMLA